MTSTYFFFNIDFTNRFIMKHANTKFVLCYNDFLFIIYSNKNTINLFFTCFDQKLVSWIYGSIRSIVSIESISETFIFKNSSIDHIDTIDLIDPEIHDTSKIFYCFKTIILLCFCALKRVLYELNRFHRIFDSYIWFKITSKGIWAGLVRK